jgi:hypothetical protein
VAPAPAPPPPPPRHTWEPPGADADDPNGTYGDDVGVPQDEFVTPAFPLCSRATGCEDEMT